MSKTKPKAELPGAALASRPITSIVRGLGLTVFPKAPGPRPANAETDEHIPRPAFQFSAVPQLVHQDWQGAGYRIAHIGQADW